MTLWILNNAQSGQVVNDLKTICPDPALAIDLGPHPDGNYGGGEVTFQPAPTASDFGTNFVRSLIETSVTVAIRGETDTFGVPDTHGGLVSLQAVGAATIFDKYPGTTLIEIVYSVNPCSGLGAWVLDSDGNHIPAPAHVRLFHEMAHADDLISGTYYGTPDFDETSALFAENSYRSLHGLPERATFGGGCNNPPFTRPPRNDCFIATAAFGSPIEPEVQLLRSFRDNVLRKTRAGAQFFDTYWKHYYRVSPLVVGAMEKDPDVRRVVRWSVVTPIVRYLELFLSFPDARLEDLAEPWRSFLTKLQNDLENWASEIDLPRSFRGVDAATAAQEIAISLKYVLRSNYRREEYLSDLERTGEIPLRGATSELQIAYDLLSQYALCEVELRRILVHPSSPRPARAAAYYFLHQEMIPASFSPPADWVYQVVITNLSGGPFDQIVVFYNQTTDLNSVVFLAQNNVQNGQVTTFTLGSCGLLYSYVVGFFVGNSQVAQIPDPNNPIFQGQPHITPALDHQIHPNDPPCLNGWTIS